jgi:hypothetical protein
MPQSTEHLVMLDFSLISLYYEELNDLAYRAHTRTRRNGVGSGEHAQNMRRSFRIGASSRPVLIHSELKERNYRNGAPSDVS